MASARTDKKRRQETESRCAAIAHDEARELFRSMHSRLAALEVSLEAAQVNLQGRPTSPKQIARLRLINDDLVSATKFASKLAKD